MAPTKTRRLRAVTVLFIALTLAVGFKEACTRPLDTHAAQKVRHKRQLNGIFTAVLDGVKNLVNTGTSVAGLGTGFLNLGGNEGIGGIVSGMLNLVSIGAEIFTGILGTVLNGDLLGGLLPFLGGQG